jgi:HD-like signal output (HDOD) protein
METIDSKRRSGETPGHGSRPHTIVFVDDEEAILSSLRSLFRKSGHSLHTFSNAAAALEFVRKTPVDLIVSDLRMPEMTGVELLNHVTGVSPQTIRLILSGYEDKTIVMNALARGLAQHFVLKPWNDAELRALVQQTFTRLGDLRRQRLESAIGSIDSLPSPPKFHETLNGLLARADVSLDALAREIETSPPIVAKLLRVANSVYYSARKSVTSVRDAVTFIGTDYVAGLVAAMEAFHGLRKNAGANVNEEIEQLWNKALKRSAIVKKIVERWPGLESPHQVHIASLLQDIGFAVRMCSDPERYARYSQLCKDGLQTSYQADTGIFGITHDDVGAALLEYWNLPPEIVHGVANHHRKTGGAALVQILQIAEIIDESDPSAPHDPTVNGPAAEWKRKLCQEQTPAERLQQEAMH